mmetsp:Transcript_9830/g.15898  ORF Transcript_9830/g.15898 Transcript_9830/m.15898 type:complete len:204 (-) Transcript_9830:159-770(-)|eukprot:CAMPEP_0169128692 /NCGR_PEP_ID=MMETSP1015-20121227/36706_1 /TAXON_ID=342587 /ORGANISM="Karlodinium micrum, Strain CCMP2283" /LENGTH=203 /DNA_ID=CAMNT_0009192617 /DNA_START=65 /DNA_END=676 /DNA_ORIENTATION=+
MPVRERAFKSMSGQPLRKAPRSGDAEQEKLNDKLHHACMKSNCDRIIQLVGRGADVMSAPGGWCHAAYTAALCRRADALSVVLAAPGIDINACGPGPTWPIFGCTANDFGTGIDGLECLELMLEAGANPALHNENNFTMLTYACSEGFDLCARRLLEDTRCQKLEYLTAADSSWGNTAESEARKRGNNELADLIRATIIASLT